MELETLASIARRWWVLLLAAALVGGVFGYAAADAATPIYEAKARLLIGPINADASTLRAAGQTSQTYAELAANDATLQAAVADLGIPDADDASVRAVASDVTRFLTLSVRHRDPDTAAAVTNAVAAQLRAVAAEELENPTVTTSEEGVITGVTTLRVGEVRLIEAADVPSSPVSPNVELITVLGVVAGLLTAVAAVLGVEYARDAVQAPESLSGLIPEPVVGRVEKGATRRSRRARLPVAVSDPEGATASSIRGVAVDIVAPLAGERRAGAVVVCGTDEQDASADVATNMALSLASLGRRVALIDADVLSQEIQTRLAPYCSQGDDVVTVFFDGKRSLTPVGSFAGLADGGLDLFVIDEDLARELTRADIKAALGELGSWYDHVIVHTQPPFGSLSTIEWASAASTCTLVVTKHHSSAESVQRSSLTLRRSGGHFAGVIFDERQVRVRPLRWLGSVIRRRQLHRRRGSLGMATAGATKVVDVTDKATTGERPARNGKAKVAVLRRVPGPEPVPGSEDAEPEGDEERPAASGTDS